MNNRTRLLQCVACAAGAFVGAFSAHAVDPNQMYRLIDLGDFSTDFEVESEAYSISENRRIVGFAKDALGRDRAFLWMASDGFGFDAFVKQDLGTNRSNNEGRAFAYEINEDGYIVAEADDEVNAQGLVRTRGMVWSPSGTGSADDASRKTALDVLHGAPQPPNDDIGFSYAFGLNDGTSFDLVGRADDDVFGTCTPGPAVLHDGAFSDAFPGAGTVDRLDTISTFQKATAISVNSDTEIVGVTGDCGTSGDTCIFLGPGGKVASGRIRMSKPTFWSSPTATPTQLALYAAGIDEEWFGIANDINTDGHIVGVQGLFEAGAASNACPEYVPCGLLAAAGRQWGG